MRVALYARVSTSEQAEHGLSIDAQIAALDEWAKDHTIVDHYTDLGVSARSPASKRPELQRMLRDCEAGKIDLIVFTKLDRFFRNVKEYYKVEDVLERTGVAWRAIHEDYETVTSAGRLKVNIMLAVAQDEADRTSERIKAVFERKRQRGLIPAGNAPFGFTIRNGELIKKDVETVQQMFQDYISSRSPQITARKYKVTARGLRYILKNEVYVKEGVVDRSTFDTAQNILASRSQRHVRSDRVYLFTGMIVCPCCGRKMTASRANGYTYYRCLKRADGDCTGRSISEKKVESALLNHLIPMIEEYNITVTDRQKKKVDPNALRKKQDRLTDLYMDELINREKYEVEFKSLQSQIEEAESTPKTIDTYEVKSLLESYSEWSPTARKAFWSNLVKSITITPEGVDFALIYT